MPSRLCETGAVYVRVSEHIELRMGLPFIQTGGTVNFLKIFSLLLQYTRYYVGLLLWVAFCTCLYSHLYS